MTDERNSFIKEKNNLLDDHIDRDHIDRENEFRENISTVMPSWSIVHFETDDENDMDGFDDLIPSSWISTLGTTCLYPMNIKRQYKS